MKFSKLSRVFLVTLILISVGVVADRLRSGFPYSLVPNAFDRLPVELAAWRGSKESAVVGSWPPVKGERYPDLTLKDHAGKTVRLSDFEGKVLLVELAAVPCAGCQAFAGGNEVGGFAGASVQRGLKSIHHYAKRFAGIDLGTSSEVVFVQLLLYGKTMSSPTQAEVAGWAQHFGLDSQPNTVVLGGDRSMLGRATYGLIPGFHLIDQDFVLRYDSSGHQPEDNLYQQLLPALGGLAR